MADNSKLISDALQKTDPQLAQAIDARNSWDTAIAKRGARVKIYRNYERGEHRAKITDQMKKMLRISKDTASELSDFNDNYCRVVVDKMAARLVVSSIKAGEAADDWLKDTLTRNDFEAQQSSWFRGGIRDGDSFVLIDPVTFLWASEPAYDGFSGVSVIFDSMTRKPVWACKLWSEADTDDIAEGEQTTAVMKMVVYQPNTVSFWQGSTGGAEVEAVNGVATEQGIDAETNVMPWPLGKIPIVHIANQLDNYTQYGESELRPAVPLQDVLNRTLHSMVMASEFSAFKLLWSIGFDVSVDGIVPGGIINLTVGDGKAYTPEDIEFLKAAKVGQFEATDLSQYTGQIDKVVQQISQATQTPIYGVTGQGGNISGEALKQLEIGLLGKIERFQRQNTDAIKELVQMTAEMQNIFDGADNAPALDTILVIWKPAEILDVNARIAALSLVREKNPGLFPDDFYQERIGSLLGLGADDIAMVIEKAKDQQGLLFEALAGGGGFVPPA